MQGPLTRFVALSRDLATLSRRGRGKEARVARMKRSEIRDQFAVPHCASPHAGNRLDCFVAFAPRNDRAPMRREDAWSLQANGASLRAKRSNPSTQRCQRRHMDCFVA